KLRDDFLALAPESLFSRLVLASKIVFQHLTVLIQKWNKFRSDARSKHLQLAQLGLEALIRLQIVRIANDCGQADGGVQRKVVCASMDFHGNVQGLVQFPSALFE